MLRISIGNYWEVLKRWLWLVQSDLYFKYHSEGCAENGWGWGQRGGLYDDCAEDRGARLSQGLRRWQLWTAGSCPLGGEEQGMERWTRTWKPGLGGAKEAESEGVCQPGLGWPPRVLGAFGFEEWSPGGRDAVPPAIRSWSRSGGTRDGRGAGPLQAKQLSG